jgi:hypothetical protein
MKLKVGDEVKFFHPGMMGVIKDGEVEKIGSKYIYVKWLDTTVRIRPVDLVVI